jgi:hypothetical protein
VALSLRLNKVGSPGLTLVPLFRKEYMMAKFGKSAQRSVKRAMHKLKEGTLKSGRSGTRVKSRQQAIAIGLSEARRKGGKVPDE